MSADLVNATLCGVITSQKESIDRLEKDLQETRQKLDKANDTSNDALKSMVLIMSRSSDEPRKTRHEVIEVAHKVFGPIARAFPKVKIQCTGDRYAINVTFGSTQGHKYGAVVFLQTSPVTDETTYLVYAKFAGKAMIFADYSREGKQVKTVEAVIESLHELDERIPANVNEEMLAVANRCNAHSFLSLLREYVSRNEKPADESNEETVNPPQETSSQPQETKSPFPA